MAQPRLPYCEILSVLCVVGLLNTSLQAQSLTQPENQPAAVLAPPTVLGAPGSVQVNPPTPAETVLNPAARAFPLDPLPNSAPAGQPEPGPLLQQPASVDFLSRNPPIWGFGSGGLGHMSTFGMPGGLGLGNAQPMMDYKVLYVPQQNAQGQNAYLGEVRENLTLRLPLYQGTQDLFTLGLRVGNDYLNNDVVFPSNNKAFPTELWDIGVTGSYIYKFDNGWIAGGSLSLNSPSDQPFHSWNETNIGGSAYLRIPSGERNAWIFSLSYSPTGQIPVPLPGVAYFWMPNDQLRMNIGLPFTLNYRPNNDWMFDFSYMLLTNIHAQATYRIWGPIITYLAYDWENSAYWLADRADTGDRFFDYDMRVTYGVKVILDDHFMFDVSTGYMFNRYYAFGDTSALSNTQDRVNIGAGGFIQASLMYRW